MLYSMSQQEVRLRADKYSIESDSELRHTYRSQTNFFFVTKYDTNISEKLGPMFCLCFFLFVEKLISDTGQC